MTPRYVIRDDENAMELWDTTENQRLLTIPYVETGVTEYGAPTVSALPRMELGRLAALLNQLSHIGGES